MVQRVYFIQPLLKEVSFAKTVQKFVSMLPADSKDNNFLRTRRLRCFPRSLENTIKDMFVKKSEEGEAIDYSLEERVPSRCDCIVYADGIYWMGLDTKRMMLPEKTQQVVPSGAYWKLLEIKERYLIASLNVLSRYEHRPLAIDIGASPGGWSYCLARNFSTKRTLAVDPAEHMHDLLKGFDVEGSGEAKRELH